MRALLDFVLHSACRAASVRLTARNTSPSLVSLPRRLVDIEELVQKVAKLALRRLGSTATSSTGYTTGIMKTRR